MLSGIGKCLEPHERLAQELLVELQPRIGAGAGKSVAAGVLAERQCHRQAELLRLDDLVGRRVLQQAVLMDAGFVREGVRADDGLVRRDVVPGETRYQRGGRSDLSGVDAGVDSETLVADTQGMTISSSAAFPARSPIPFTVHST